MRKYTFEAFLRRNRGLKDGQMVLPGTAPSLFSAFDPDWTDERLKEVAERFPFYPLNNLNTPEFEEEYKAYMTRVNQQFLREEKDGRQEND